MSQFNTGVTFDILGNGSGLDKELAQTVTRAKSAAAEISRIKVEVPIKINEAAFRADAQRIISQVQAEANRVFEQRGGRFPGGGGGGGGGGPLVTSGFAGSGFSQSGGGRGGGGAGGGGDESGGDSLRGIRRTFQAVALIEGAIAGGAVVVKGMSAAADAMNGDTKLAMSKLADVGDSLKNLKGPVGAIVRLTAELMDDFLIPGKSVGQIEADTKKIDAKSDIMEARNKFARSTNEKFKAVADAEADRTAKENAATPSEAALVDLARQRKELQKTIDNSNVKGVDKDAAQKALDALTHRETNLRAKAAAEREEMERKHQAALTETMAKGQAERLKAEGFTEAAERAALEARQHQETEKLYTELSAETQPAKQKQIIQRILATRAEQEQETAAFDAEQQRKEVERAKQSAEASSNFAAAAGEAGLKREQQREAVAKDTRGADFEARQADLKTGGFSERARMEAINRKADEDLRTAEDPAQREAIKGRQGAELRALLKEVAGAPNTRAELVADPTRTAFGRGGLGVGDNTSGLKQLDATLKGAILDELQRITKAVKTGGTALTS